MNYKQIFIKSEDDLPKGTDAYISHSNSGHIGFRRCVPAKPLDHTTFENVSGEWWMKNIDWYLLPVPETTYEEIEEWIEADAHWAKTFINGAIYGAIAMRDGKIKSTKP